MTKIALLLLVLLGGCATPPSSDPSTADASCAQQCSANLATCSSGFKLFPIVQQKQCNDNYDVCVRGCPARSAATSASPTADRLKALEELRKSGAVTDTEYAAKRKEILESL